MRNATAPAIPSAPRRPVLVPVRADRDKPLATVHPLRPRPGTPVAVTAPKRPTRGTYLRRRIVALLVLVAVIIAVTALVTRADAGLDDPVAGQVALAPGDTLWEVAVATAPDGVDPREQLDAIVELNGFTTSRQPAWTVVLIPAR